MEHEIEKAIFLDLDGVLINDWSRVQDPSTWFRDFLYPFDPDCVKLMNQLLAESAARIVLSTEARFRYNDKALIELFEFNAMPINPIRIPHNFLGRFKGHDDKYILKKTLEIEVFVKEHNLKHFVILDDWELRCFPDHFLQTNASTGLRPNDLPKIISILDVEYHADTP